MPTQTQPSVAEREDEVVDDFGLFDDWADKYAYLIELGKNAETFPDSLKAEEYLVPGCQSRVWLVPLFEDGLVTFRANSDAFISGGLVALAVKIYSGHAPEEIVATPPRFIEKMGMGGNISMTRMNGLQAVINKMKQYAQAFAQAGKQ